MHKVLWILVLTSISLPTWGQTIVDSLTMRLAEEVRTNSMEGCSVAILTKDSVLYTKGFGYADRDTKRPYTLENVQPIGSISKTFIAIALLKAQELGELDLDDAVNKYLPFELVHPRYPEQSITLRHLATHSAGLKDTKHYWKSYVFKEELPAIYKEMPLGFRRMQYKSFIKQFAQNKAMPLTDYLQQLYTPEGDWYSRSNFLKEAPGKAYEYSNSGSAFAALAIEGATGMSYKDFVAKHILEPLKMTQTSWSMHDYEELERTKLYFAGHEIPNYELITYPDGGLVTNMTDFLSYFQAVLKGYQGEENPLLQAESFEEIFQLQVDPSFSSGIFWEVRKNNIGHTGNDPGLATCAYFSRKDGTACIFFSNFSDTKTFGKDFNNLFRILKKYSKKLQPLE